MKLVSKWNGKNYYWFNGDQIVEVIKLGGDYYRLKYKNGSLIPVGNPLKKSEFTLVG